LWYGDSEGENWSEPVILPFVGIVPDKVRVLGNGRIIVSAHFKNKETDKLEQYLWYSDDKGETWSDRIIVAADKRYNLCEASILECGNNTLVCFLRENSRIGCDVLKVISYDNGEHWSEIYTTQMDCGHRPVSGFLNDGRIMVTYRYIPGKTQNTFAAFFEKDALFETSRQKQPAIIMPLDFDRNVNADGGYTGWTQFDDGEIYVVNYIRDDADKAYIRGYSFYPEDVQLPSSETNTQGVF
jgi:sialidase-1